MKTDLRINLSGATSLMNAGCNWPLILSLALVVHCHKLLFIHLLSFYLYHCLPLSCLSSNLPSSIFLFEWCLSMCLKPSAYNIIFIDSYMWRLINTETVHMDRQRLGLMKVAVPTDQLLRSYLPTWLLLKKEVLTHELVNQKMAEERKILTGSGHRHKTLCLEKNFMAQVRKVEISLSCCFVLNLRAI